MEYSSHGLWDYYVSVDSIKKMLPKTYLQRKHVASEVCVALTHYKSLVPMVDKYVFNDGTEKQLMSLSGTIPIMFEDSSYNIPVSLWLLENYPETPPICYVKPTPEMMILKGNYINSDGEILMPYQQEWKQSDCDLVNLLQVMSVMFGEFPPVCVRPRSEVEQQACSQQVSHRETEDGNSYVFLSRDDGQPLLQNNETIC